MRCRYCFGAISDRSTRCPHCGSKQPPLARPAVAAGPDSAAEVVAGKEPAGSQPAPPLTARQAGGVLGGLLLLVSCICFVLITLINPALLPRPVLAVLPFLASPTPMPTSQVTRAPLATPTAATFAEHTNLRGRFSLEFPTGWLVVDQSRSGWQDDVRDLNDEFGWAATLFEVSRLPETPQSRAIDPARADPDNGRLVIFTANVADPAGVPPSLTEIEALLRDDPLQLAELAGGLTLLGDLESGNQFQSRRSERLTINGRPALLVEFLGSAQVGARPLRVRVRLYFVTAGEELYAAGYLADERAALENRDLYDGIIHSFTLR